MAFLSLVFFVAMMVSIASAQIPPAAGPYKREAIAAWRSVYGINAPTATLAAQVHQESSWNIAAVSRTGAFGLPQFMPATASDVNKRYTREFAGLPTSSATWQFKAQALYMQEIASRIQAENACEKMAFTLQGYNGGPGRINQRKKLSSQPLKCFHATCDINPGILPSNQKEAQEYPVRILLKIEPRYIDALWGIGSCR